MKHLLALLLATTPLVAQPSFTKLMGLKSGSINPNRNELKDHDHREIRLLSLEYRHKIRRLRRVDEGTPFRIPQVIHFIWIGPRPFPQESIANVTSWRKEHPDWVMKFWTDRHQPPVASMERHLVQEYEFGSLTRLIGESTNWGEKSDLMRFKILYDEGGIYADHDAECLHSFEALAKAFDFVACCERPHSHPYAKTCVLPAIGLIMVKPHHPIMDATIDCTLANWQRLTQEIPVHHVRARVIQRTFDSFVLATKAFRDVGKNIDIILPTAYFYPDRTLDRRTTHSLQRRGYVWSSHKYAGAWKPEAVAKKTQ